MLRQIYNYGSIAYTTEIYNGLLYIYLLIDTCSAMEDIPSLLAANLYIGQHLHIDSCSNVLPELVKMGLER
jgi:hypothetical protein